MTFFAAMMLEAPTGQRRSAATWWAFAASLVCALLLWRYAAPLSSKPAAKSGALSVVPPAAAK
jgi:hypothetical protein